MEKIEKMCVRRVHRHAARKVGAVGSAKRLARAAPATKMFRLAAVAEQNSNGTGLNDRRRPQNFARPAAAALPNGWPFPENCKRTGQKDRLERGSYRTHIFSILKKRISYHDHPTIT